MKALTAAEMREVDRLTTERCGISQMQLMENAGQKVANAVWRVVAGREKARVCVLCGKGNNGGDGLVAARLLVEDVPTRVILFGRPEEVRGEAASNLAKWRDAGHLADIVSDASDWERLRPGVASCPVIVDALLGTGLRGAPTGVMAQAIADFNKLSRDATAPTPALVLSVDIPSGLASDGEPSEGEVLRAHHTVTFTAPKIGQLLSRHAEACGALEVVSIGSPAALIEETGKSHVRWIDPTEFTTLPLVRSRSSHKGRFGHLLLLAGSVGKSGAAILAGHAALRGGAGLVTIAMPESVQPIVAAGQAEYMTEPLKATKTGALSVRSLVDGTFGELEDGKSVLAIGPGLGTHRQTQEFIRTIVTQTDLPVVLDADGLNAFAGHVQTLRKRKSKFLAVTPHPGEMARLLDTTTAKVESDRVATARESALQWNAHVILKGFHTLIASPEGQLFVNTSGNPGLAKGGSGDVLTGLLSACLAQFPEDKYPALALGVYLHGVAADLLATEDKDLSGMLASEVSYNVPAPRDWLLRELQFRA